MDVIELINLEIALTTLVALGVGWLIRSINTRFRSIEEDMKSGFDQLHSRINGVKDAGAKEHKKIAVEIAKLQTTLEIRGEDKAA